MADFVTLITNNGIGIVCVAFLLYFIQTTQKDNIKILQDIQKTLVSIQDNLQNLTTRIDTIELKINESEKEK